MCRTKKVGHGGTLDPMAEGVLPVFIGNATKAVDYCPDTDKEYVAGFKFGITTDTQDITGTVITENDGYVSRNKMIFIERIKGEIEQIPPMYSAVHVNGQRLYELARKGAEVERQARKVTVYGIKVENYRDNEGVMRISCSKGTYVRTLIHDIGQDIGNGAVMTSLIRTKSGIFTLDNAHTLEELNQIAAEKGYIALQDLMIPVDELFKKYPKAYLDGKQTELYTNGAALLADLISLEKVYTGEYAVYNCNGQFIALAKILPDHSFRIIQRFNTAISINL
jgi:tRNA pseudouridine55 synthase